MKLLVSALIAFNLLSATARASVDADVAHRIFELFSNAQLENAMRRAIQAQDIESVKMLISVTGHNLSEDIEIACGLRNQAIAELLRHAHALDAWDEYGTTALYRAAVRGDVEEARRLIRAGARVNA